MFEPLPPQWAFLSSEAKIRGYGGAMGGGKSRALCEDAFDEALLYPGLKTLICRQAHTSIIGTTKKTMIEQVIPREMMSECRKKESGGEDWIQLPNGSVMHFVGLDDPIRWFSSELGKLVFDEAHEIKENDVLTLRTRLRQPGMQHLTTIAFNPSNPGHWLQQWFILDAERTPFGYRKEELWLPGASASSGSCEFISAKATDNPYLPDGYVEERLASMPAHLRRRYLEGLWEFITGSCYFDGDALLWYGEQIDGPWRIAKAEGDLSGTNVKDMPALRHASGGLWHVWKAPVKEKMDEETGKTSPRHRYILGVDTSAGTGGDYSSVQVLDVDDMEQVAEYRGQIDPDLLAEECLRVAAVYNGALIAPEVTGGWGNTVVQELARRLLPNFRNGSCKPRLFTRRKLDRLSQRWTDVLGWDTKADTRPLMLDTLERYLRQRALKLHGQRTLVELGTFVLDDNGKAQAQPGCHDDMVISLAIAVTLADREPRQQKRPKPVRRQPQFSRTGY